jgi:hypothetical protein
VNVLIACLNVAGAALVLIGIGEAARTFRRSERRVLAERKQLEQIAETYGNDSEGRQRAMADSGIGFTTWADLTFLQQDIQLAAIKEAKPGLTAALILTVLGTFATLVSAALSVHW